MKRSHAFLVAPLLILFACVSSAQVPSGHFTYTFTNLPLWDLTGTYTNNTDPSDVVIAQIQHQATGRIAGVRSETYISGADHAQGSGSTSGRVFVKAGTVGIRVTEVAGFTGLSQGVFYEGSFKAKEIAVIVPATLMVFVSGTAHICVLGGKCVSRTEGFSLPLPVGVNGNWMLDFEITADGNNLEGAASLIVSNGRILTYHISGSYNLAAQTSKLKLVGTGEATGTSLTLTADGEEMNLTTLKAKVLGQRVNLP